LGVSVPVGLCRFLSAYVGTPVCVQNVSSGGPLDLTCGAVPSAAGSAADPLPHGTAPPLTNAAGV
jgi:hypothetical protein